MARSIHELPDSPIGGSEIADQHALMELGPPFKHRRDECDAEAAAPVAAEVRQARALVVLVLGQIRICELADWNEHESIAKTLKASCQSKMEIVSLGRHPAIVEE